MDSRRNQERERERVKGYRRTKKGIGDSECASHTMMQAPVLKYSKQLRLSSRTWKIGREEERSRTLISGCSDEAPSLGSLWQFLSLPSF